MGHKGRVPQMWAHVAGLCLPDFASSVICSSSATRPFLSSFLPSLRENTEKQEKLQNGKRLDVSDDLDKCLVTMSLPANDAFSLALAHSNDSSMPSRRRSLTRSPSPKIPFTPTNDSPKRRPGTRRRVSKGSVASGVEGGIPSTNSTLQEIDEKEDTLEVERRLLGQPEEKAAEKKKKVDWEIPRKTLHASIGTRSCDPGSAVRCAVQRLMSFHS